MFGKWFASAYTGSMAGSGADVFAVWGYVIAHAFNSYVDLNPAVIGALIGMPVENVQRAIDYLCLPDPQSRNHEQDGRRLVRETGFQYQVVSQAIYRKVQSAEDRREYFRIKQQESRARRKQTQVSNGNVKECQHCQTCQQGQLITETDTEEETEASTPAVASKEKSPRTSTSARRQNGEPRKPSPEEEIYRQYPRKVGMRKAIAAIENAVERVRKGEGGKPPIPGKREACVYLFRRTQAYARSPLGQRPDRDKIPHPSTWFNQSRYLDEDSEWQEIGNGSGKSPPPPPKPPPIPVGPYRGPMDLADQLEAKRNSA